MGLSDQKGATNSVYQPMKSTKGGYKAAVFVFALTALENVGFFANMVSIVLYCATVMHFDLSGSANTTTNFLGTAYLLSLVGGVISDSFMNRLNTSLIFGGFALLGYVLLIIQSHDTKLQPEVCGEYSCVSGGKAVLFYASLYLAALGGGGMRGSVPALGGDQFDQNDPKEKKHLASYFNYLLFSITCGACVGVTIVVWVSENKGWYKGFLISLACLFLGLCILAMGKPFYRVRVPAESAVFRILQVLVVTLRNLRVKLPENPRDLYEKHDYDISAGEEQIHYSKQFRLLDKAAVLREGAAPKKWRVCTVTQVEEVKVITRMLPIIFSTIIMNTCLAQLQTFTVQQGVLMNTKIGTFKVPPASIPFIPLAFMTVLIPIYDIFFVPIMRKFTGHPGGITHLQRVGVGLVLCVLSMSIAGVVEVKRKNDFKDHNERISLFWLAIHYGIFGLADMFTLVGLLDFFYSEAPKGMRSLSTSFAFLSLSFGYFLSTVFVDIINSVTSKGTSSHRGWLDGLDLNNDHLEYFYWFLAVVSLLNFGNYVFWASWYNYKKDVPIEKQNLIHRSPSEGGNGSSASKPHEIPTQHH